MTNQEDSGGDKIPCKEIARNEKLDTSMWNIQILYSVSRPHPVHQANPIFSKEYITVVQHKSTLLWEIVTPIAEDIPNDIESWKNTHSMLHGGCPGMASQKHKQTPEEALEALGYIVEENKLDQEPLAFKEPYNCYRYDILI